MSAGLLPNPLDGVRQTVAYDRAMGRYGQSGVPLRRTPGESNNILPNPPTGDSGAYNPSLNINNENAAQKKLNDYDNAAFAAWHGSLTPDQRMSYLPPGTSANGTLRGSFPVQGAPGAYNTVDQSGPRDQANLEGIARDNARLYFNQQTKLGKQPQPMTQNPPGQSAAPSSYLLPNPPGQAAPPAAASPVAPSTAALLPNPIGPTPSGAPMSRLLPNPPSGPPAPAAPSSGVVNRFASMTPLPQGVSSVLPQPASPVDNLLATPANSPAMFGGNPTVPPQQLPLAASTNAPNAPAPNVQMLAAPAPQQPSTPAPNPGANPSPHASMTPLPQSPPNDQRATLQGNLDTATYARTNMIPLPQVQAQQTQQAMAQQQATMPLTLEQMRQQGAMDLANANNNTKRDVAGIGANAKLGVAQFYYQGHVYDSDAKTAALVQEHQQRMEELQTKMDAGTASQKEREAFKAEEDYVQSQAKNNFNDNDKVKARLEWDKENDKLAAAGKSTKPYPSYLAMPGGGQPGDPPAVSAAPPPPPLSIGAAHAGSIVVQTGTNPNGSRAYRLQDGRVVDQQGNPIQ